MLEIKNQINNYSDNEVVKMKREAINRVREMQRLAKKNIVKTNNCNMINKISSKEIDLKERLEYKGKQCIICGYSKCIQALDFHHLHDKDFNLSDRNLKLDWIEIKKELDKCIVVCANCHREIHANYKILSEEDYEF